ncbi:MAG: patatin family protein [Oscillospiraceae bacterium]|nr:patatin family protein [Oscillospiraceae bacterium]
MNFTQPVIKGVKCTNILPQGFSLVLEGGGTRGFFSAGVLDAFLKQGIMFPYIIGVSAGCANALSYVSGQYGRNRDILTNYVKKHEYLSRRNLVRHGSLFGYDYIFETIPKNHIFFDKEVYDEQEVRFLTGAADCINGKTVWFEKEEMDEKFTASRASCSVPFLSKPVKINDMLLLDGGIFDPIPIDKSIEDGNTFHVIVLTRNHGYIKPPFKRKALAKSFYSKHPKIAQAILERHEIYNRQSALCEELEAAGKALIIRPQKPLKNQSMSGKNIPELLKLYDEGEEEGLCALKTLKKYY